MSSYLNIYLKVSDEQFINIFSFSRSSEMYAAFEHSVPYGTSAPCKLNTLLNARDSFVDDEFEYWQKEQDKLERQEKLIMSASDVSIDERINKIYEIHMYDDQSLAWLKEQIQAREIINSLLMIRDNYESDYRYYGLKDADISYDEKDRLAKEKADNYIYMGIDCRNPMDDPKINPNAPQDKSNEDFF